MGRGASGAGGVPPARGAPRGRRARGGGTGSVVPLPREPDPPARANPAVDRAAAGGWSVPPGGDPMLRRLPMMAAAALLPILAAAPSAAQDEPIELADDPFEITDPIAPRPGEAELAAFGFYERARRGRTRDTVGAEIEAEFGVAPRLEPRLGKAGAYGNLETRRRLDAAAPDRTPGVPGGGGGVGGEETGAAWGGATRLGLLYQLTEDDG